jgi:protein O-GlcNAc transferase
LAGLDDDRAAAVIASDGIDVLFDLSGHTAGGRLLVFARRPAPVQAAWIGYFGTTGVTGIDWLVADRHVVPPSHDRWYSEKVIRLPDGYVCYRPSVGAPDVSAPPSDRNGYVTFGSCNAVAKVTPEVVGLWAAILRETGGSRLLLKAAGFDTPAVAARIRAEFATHGIDESRLELEGWSSYEEFLGTYSRIDVAVDPFPFGGGLTTVETLWAGVPLVTYAADRFAGRQSTSHLSVIGHQELVAQSLDQYRSLAIALGGDPDRRRQLRATLRQDMARSPLCDGERFARNLQRAIRGMWESRS